MAALLASLFQGTETSVPYFAESIRLSPPSNFPPALKRKKLLESGFENEAGNEKREEGDGDGLRMLMTLRSGILGMVWQESKRHYLTGKNIKG
jgi:hypothetical protein